MTKFLQTLKNCSRSDFHCIIWKTCLGYDIFFSECLSMTITLLRQPMSQQNSLQNCFNFKLIAFCIDKDMDVVVMFSFFVLQFISHPFLFKRVKMRWQRGSPFTESAGILHFLLWLLLIMIDTLLTPFLLPLIGYVYYRDQKNKSKRTPAEEHQSKNVFGMAFFIFSIAY